MKVNFEHSLTSTARLTEKTLDDVVWLIRNDHQLLIHTQCYRDKRKAQQAAANPQERQQLDKDARQHKTSCPAIFPAVTLTGGKQRRHIDTYTALLQLDFDHIAPDRLAAVLDLLRADTHTLLLYTTISGEGCRVLCRYEAAPDVPQPCPAHPLYLAAWQLAANHYTTLTRCTADEQVRNPVQACGLAYDPEAHYQPEATPFAVGAHDVAEAAQADSAQREATTRQPSKRTVARCTKRVEQLLRQEGIGCQEGGRNKYVSRGVYMLNKYGVAPDDALLWAQRVSDQPATELAAVVRSVYTQHTDEHGSWSLRTDADTSATAQVADMERFLHTAGRFRYNVVTGVYEFCAATPPAGTDHDATATTTPAEEWRPLDDYLFNSLLADMRRQMRVRKEEFRTLIESEFSTRFDPFAHYVEQLPPWDGHTDYIGLLAATVVVTPHQGQTEAEAQAFFADCFRRWMVAMVRCWLTDSVNETMLILVGGQGKFKSSWIARLLPPQLRGYYMTGISSRAITKDDRRCMVEKGLVGIDEFSERTGTDLDELKDLVTCRTVTLRLPYDKYVNTFARRASLIATTNKQAILTDPTGNRRFPCFEVESIRDPYTFEIPYDGVYAQATALWRSGFKCWFDAGEFDRLEQQNSSFYQPNIEEELILTYYEVPRPGMDGFLVNTAQILERITTNLHGTKINAVKIGIAMKKLGFEKVKIRGINKYRVIELNFDDIKARKLPSREATDTQPPASSILDFHDENGENELPF